jgi:succinate-semialdehyde dehydrogenase/glutarate-semialdehyde dehydrogenase
MMVRSFAPATGEPLAELASASDEEVRAATARARKAQRAWAILPPAERADRLLRLRDALAEHAEDLVALLARESGKPRHEALVHEVASLLELIAWTCKHVPAALAEPRTYHEPPSLSRLRDRVHETRFSPRGVLGVISPSAFPLVGPVGIVVRALVCGNACLVKPSPQASLAALEAKKLYDSTGLPEDLFAVLVGHGETAQALIAAGIDQCIFAGGARAARMVASACGAQLLPCVLRVRGRTALFACEDCDLDRTARSLVYGAFANAGQSFASVRCAFVHTAAYDGLVARVSAGVVALRQGDPSCAYVDVGALSSRHRIDVLRRCVEDARTRGARVVQGGLALPQVDVPEPAEGAGTEPLRSPGNPRGAFFPPTVLFDCDSSMSILKEEVVGPVLALLRVRDEDEAVSLAGDLAQGDIAYVFTRSRARARRLAERLAIASVVVNDTQPDDVPSDGSPVSDGAGGVGLGPGPGAVGHAAPVSEGLLNLCRSDSFSYDRVPAKLRDALGFPYTAKNFQWLQRATRLLFGAGTWTQRIGRMI